jgi:tricorn protease interacting factor F2/3
MQSITPVHYKIRLEPDLVNFSFSGRCELSLQAAEPVAEVSLNILEIAIWGCRAWQADQRTSCAFKVDPAAEEVLIYLPGPMTGDIKLEIDYQGLINDKMAGFYRSKYTHQEQTRYIAVTQFEESDARRAFPCIDHPAAKATFEISMDIDSHLVAISNTAVQTEKMLANGKKRVCFGQTPKMSTYLVFFGVGEFEITVDKDDQRVRSVTLPGMRQFAQFGTEFGRKSLAFSESYYDLAYPLDKMDLIAIPDFAFGAMENWGAITFRENLLLHYPGITSKSGEERICEVIAHEIAHQWFGNLVTPADWRYLWLNESFATYFGFGVVDHHYPQWQTWQQFLFSQTGTALARDGLAETFAIEIPGGEHVVINVSTAPIIYSKGSSILMQIKGYIGEENFKQGLQHYLKTYEYGCAASHHLWESFEAVSRQPVRAMMKSWIEQPGFPMITVERRGNQLVLGQQRFTYLPNDAGQQWLVPITIRLFSKTGAARQVSLLLDGREQAIDVDEDIAAYKVNDRQTGFYRVAYRDPKNMAELGRRVREKSLTPEDRWGLQNDLFARVKGGRATLDAYLDWLGYYDTEDAYLPLASTAENLHAAYLVLDEDSRQKIASLATPKFEALLANIGYEPRPDDDHPTAQLRDQIIWHAAVYGSRATLDFVRDRFGALMTGAAIHPDIMKSVMQAGALSGDARVFDWFDQRFQVSQIEHERINILSAIGCFKDAGLIQKTQRYLLERVPARNKFIPVVALCANPHAIELMWDWYVANLERIEQFHPLLYERVVAAIIPTAGIYRADEVNAFFDDYRAQKDKASDVIKLSLERLEINLRMRRSGKAQLVSDS